MNNQIIGDSADTDRSPFFAAPKQLRGGQAPELSEKSRTADLTVSCDLFRGQLAQQPAPGLR